MSYITLKDLYYQHPEQHETLYHERFNGSDTIHLDFQIHDFPAFIVQNIKLYSILLDIQKTDKRIRHLHADLPGIAIQQFAMRCLIDEIVITNDIEGVNSTRREIHAVLDKLEDKRQPVRFEGQVRKYLMLQNSQSISLNTSKDIRNIYNDLVLSEVKNEDPENAPDGHIFRRDSVSVTNSSQREIHRGVYPESKIIEYMESALSFLNDSRYEALIRISAFHYLFGYIHPFYDGNGRLSRFISSYLLSQELDPLIGYRLSYTVKERLKDYYGAFKTANDFHNNGDVTPFVLVFLSIVQESMRQLESALEKRSDQLAYYTALLKKTSPLSHEPYYTLAYFLLQAGLFSENGISTKDLIQYSKLSRSGLSNHLRVFESNNLLLSEKHGREKFYQLNLKTLEALSQ